MDLYGRAALVTGAAGGLGAAAARHLAAHDMRVVIFDRNAATLGPRRTYR
jgi:NAD(P)-dependent dehydrogenase (short-subunit alcohol dehydrogenase family)